MRNILLSRNTYVFIRVMLGGIFVYSGLLKLSDLKSFSEVIYSFGLIPYQIKTLTAFLISFSELIAGAGLILDIKGSLTAISSMLILFMVVLAYGIHMGFDIDCGCFGQDDPIGAALHGLRDAFFRDIILVLLTFYIYKWRNITSFESASPILYYKKFVHKKCNQSDCDRNINIE